MRVGLLRSLVSLTRSLGDIDPETVNVLVEPEPQNLIELILDPRVAPVQVRLVWQEEMEVVLTGLVVKGPGGPTEVTDPVVWGPPSAPGSAQM